MANDAPITGAPTRAPAFADFNTRQLDDISGDLSMVRHLIDTAVDLVPQDEARATSLLFATLVILERGDTQFQSLHAELLRLKNAEARHA